MVPNQFLIEIVRPNVAIFHEDFASLRHAFNAVAGIDALAAHIFVWCKENKPAEIEGVRDDTEYRAALALRCSAFRLLRDIAKANKHVHLTRGDPQVTSEAQVKIRPIGYGVGGFGCGRFGGPPQVVVDTNGGAFEY